MRRMRVKGVERVGFFWVCGQEGLWWERAEAEGVQAGRVGWVWKDG